MVTTCRLTGGARRDRTADLLRAKQALSQLSYGPVLTCLFSSLLRLVWRQIGRIADLHGRRPPEGLRSRMNAMKKIRR